MRRAIDCTLSVLVFALVFLLFVVLSGRVFGLDPLPPPVPASGKLSKLPPPVVQCEQPTHIGRAVGFREYWAGFGWVEWSGTGWVKVESAPEVAGPRGVTFPGPPKYNPGHNCPECGRSQYVIAGFNRDGTHTHICSAGHSWRH